ncbi:MFS transporter [Blastococcus sp. TF02A_35]|uniref:MFS transporter n=1 Tax=Blastococcus sp. TF02A-35 TaxID=2559612 RepID=UPI001073069B|nr:MFS transporter [Blastococcus sp. TF02A_35]TFV52389.1 MFS transporter [Blastococcus sp. TF02A_35]
MTVAPPRSTRRAWLPVALTMFAIGWGANQFVSLLVAYRERSGFSVSTVDALVGAYALGLIPALLVLGPISDRRGRTPVLRAAAVVSLVATAVLMVGDLWALYAGRLLAGLASGAAFAAGSAWVEELSTKHWDPDAREGAGARRAAMSLTAGFCLGPVVAGLLAQWAPAPLVTAYLPHLVVVLAVLVPLWRAPETVDPARVSPAAGSPLARLRVRSAADPRFRRSVAPVAPWVFGAATISIAVLPGLVTGTTAGWTVAFSSLVAGVTLGTGFLVQPTARRIAAASPRRGVVCGLAAVVVGLGTAAAAAATTSPWLVATAAVVLGTGYGCCLVSGLIQTQRIAAPGELAGLTAVYYALTYVGFAAPVLLSLLAALVPYWVLLLGAAGLAAATLAVAVGAPRGTALSAR